LFTETAAAFFCLSFGAGSRGQARAAPTAWHGPPVHAAPWPASWAPPPYYHHYFHYGGRPGWRSRSCPAGNTGYTTLPSACPTH
jgi:hypothetical protein